VSSSKPKAEADIRQAALRLLARREHSVSELGRKLANRGYAAETVKPVLQALVAEGLLDNERFGEMYVRSHVARGAGPIRIGHELARHDLSRSQVETFLAPFDEQWTRLAAVARRKRFGAAAPADARERGRQSRFLHQRGFTGEQIRRALTLEDETIDDGVVD
jgi:regulatory protein